MPKPGRILRGCGLPSSNDCCSLWAYLAIKQICASKCNAPFSRCVDGNRGPAQTKEWRVGITHYNPDSVRRLIGRRICGVRIGDVNGHGGTRDIVPGQLSEAPHHAITAPVASIGPDW